jgi:hypothetical protein
MRSAGEFNWASMAIGLKPDESHRLHFPFDVDTKTNTMHVRIISPRAPLPFADQDRFIFDADATRAGPKTNGSMITKD